MSFFGRLFAAPKVIEKTVDAAIATGDALVFTDEERSIANQKTLEWVLRFHEASKGSNVARRLLAIMFSAVFLFLVLIVMYTTLLGMSETADRLMELIADTLATPITVILAFYFTSGIARDFMDKR